MCACKMTAPWVPKIKDALDCSNFEPYEGNDSIDSGYKDDPKLWVGFCVIACPGDPLDTAPYPEHARPKARPSSAKKPKRVAADGAPAASARSEADVRIESQAAVPRPRVVDGAGHSSEPWKSVKPPVQRRLTAVSDATIEAQLFVPAVPYPQWDYNWDHRDFDSHGKRRKPARRRARAPGGATSSSPRTSSPNTWACAARSTAASARRALPRDPGGIHHSAAVYRDGARVEAAFRRYFKRALPYDETDDDDDDDEFAATGLREAEAGDPTGEYGAIVCHANVIRFLFLRALQLPPETWLRLCTMNCSITA
ncbi:hypothetical protein JL720_13504 [Aureococcus anophagefferens]|nr:hypothetical protein JL720_13504 [Aureococcus anophagefferens]